MLKDYVFWGVFGLSIVVGGLASSVAIFDVVNNDWEIAGKLGHHPVSFGLKTLPYFWFVVLALFIVLAYFNFKHTKKGYKFRLPLTVLASVLASIILGFAFFGMGVAQKMDEQALKHIPLYKSFHFQQRIDNWSQPDKGVLAGEIISVNGQSFILSSLNGEQWVIDVQSLPPHFITDFEEGMIIGVLGENQGANVFSAEHIKPWKGNFAPPRRLNFLPMKENSRALRII